MPRFVNRRNTFVSVLLGGALLVPCALPAAAQAPGVRGGVSVDPDQIYLGGHYETGPLVERLHFKPNLEVGFGDDITHLGFNFEFVYKYPVNSDWTLYGGGGPAINVFSFDAIDESDTEGGLNILFGAETPRGLFFEFKLGALDSPDVKFGVGWTFR